MIGSTRCPRDIQSVTTKWDRLVRHPSRRGAKNPEAEARVVRESGARRLLAGQVRCLSRLGTRGTRRCASSDSRFTFVAPQHGSRTRVSGDVTVSGLGELTDAVISPVVRGIILRLGPARPSASPAPTGWSLGFPASSWIRRQRTRIPLLPSLKTGIPRPSTTLAIVAQPSTAWTRFRGRTQGRRTSARGPPSVTSAFPGSGAVLTHLDQPGRPVRHELCRLVIEDLVPELNDAVTGAA